MARFSWVASAVLAVLSVGVIAQDDDSNCQGTGVDYTDGGTYSIDSTDEDQFSFDTLFQGCIDETVSPILIDPNGNEIWCSDIETQPDNTDQFSTW